MKTFALIALIELQGLVWVSLVAGRVGGVTSGFVSWPLGLVMFVGVGLLGALSPLPTTTAGLFVAFMALLVLGGGLVWRRRLPGLDRAVASRMVAVGVFICLAGALLGQIDLTVMTMDSHVLLREGRAMMFYDEPPIHGELSNRGVFMMIAQGASIRLGVGYLSELAPLLALCLTGAFVDLGARGLATQPSGRRRARLVAGLTAAALMSPYLMLLHAFYVHVNLAAAVYLFLSVACFWSAEREAEPAWLGLAFVFLAGFVLQRVEAIGLALALCTMAFGRTRLPDAPWRWGLVAVFLAALAWHVEIAVLAGPGSRILTPPRAAVAIGLIGAWGAVMAVVARPQLRVWRSRLATAVPFALGLVTLAAAASHPGGVMASLGSLLDNSVGLEWGGLWPAMAALGLGSFFLVDRREESVPGRWLFAATALGQVAFVVMLSAARIHPYTPFWQDSGNRMLIHATPLLLFWLMLVYGPGLVSSGRSAEYNASAAPTHRPDPGAETS